MACIYIFTVFQHVTLVPFNIGVNVHSVCAAGFARHTDHIVGSLAT